MIRTFLGFILGALSATLLFAVLRHGNSSITERDSDIGLGNALLQDVQVADTAADFIRSNQLQKAEVLLNGVAFTSLQEAWVISKKYNGVLDEKLNPLLLATYPKVRRQLNWKLFEHWPKPMLIQVTNFMTAADTIAQSKRE